MCFYSIHSRLKEKFIYCRNRFVERTREVWCCFRYNLKRKYSDPINSFYNPYYDPSLVELREVVVIPNKFIGKKIISNQPKNELLFSESSDDEIIFEKKPKKHLVEINEDNAFKNIFNPLKKRRLSYDLNLSKIPEDIDSSVERSSPSPEIPFISSPISNKEMEFDNLEEEISLKLSNSKISVKSINLGEKEEDNWDLVTE